MDIASFKPLLKKPVLLIVAGGGGLVLSFLILRKVQSPAQELAPLQPIEITVPGTLRPAERGSSTLDDDTGPTTLPTPNPTKVTPKDPKPIDKLRTSPVTPINPTPAPVNPAPINPKPAPVAKTYPGLPPGFVLDPANTYTGLLGTFEQMKATQLKKGKGPTFTNRNTTAIAVQGTPTPWLGRGPFDAASVNQRRVKFGLYPLTQEEFDAMKAHMRSLHGGSEGINGDDNARQLFAKWHFPYQVKVRGINNK